MPMRHIKAPRIGAWRQTGKRLRAWRAFGRIVPWIQGPYYILTASWSLLSIDTFIKVTGPKRDIWLVRIVGLLLVVCGTVLPLSAIRRRTPLEIALLDTLFEAAFILGWTLNGKSKPAATYPPPR